MKTKELCIKIDNLQGKINFMNKVIDNAVYKYLDDCIGIESANSGASDDLIGKAVAEEFHWYWNREMNLITICYSTFRNKWGDINDKEYEINVDFYIIDKYIKY